MQTIIHQLHTITRMPIGNDLVLPPEARYATVSATPKSYTVNFYSSAAAPAFKASNVLVTARIPQGIPRNALISGYSMNAYQTPRQATRAFNAWQNAWKPGSSGHWQSKTIELADHTKAVIRRDQTQEAIIITWHKKYWQYVAADTVHATPQLVEKLANAIIAAISQSKSWPPHNSHGTFIVSLLPDDVWASMGWIQGDDFVSKWFIYSLAAVEQIGMTPLE